MAVAHFVDHARYRYYQRELEYPPLRDSNSAANFDRIDVASCCKSILKYNVSVLESSAECHIVPSRGQDLCFVTVIINR